MKTKILAKKTAACFIAACMAAQPAFAAPTDISSVPLGTAAGAGYLPNLLFTLDNSGSMAWEFLPDYVDPSTSNNGTSFPCMSTSTGSTDCTPGDPPYTAGGQFAMNGVGYDPNFNYLPGLDSDGTPHLSKPSGTLDRTKVPDNAYVTGSPTKDLTANNAVQDRRFCNGNNVCKRNGAADSTNAPVLPSGATDASTPTAHTLGAGQFPWRTHPSNSSTLIFGLPEQMSLGTFMRNTTGTGGFVGSPTSTVRVTTVEPHGLSNGNLVFTNVTNMAVTCVAVANVTPTTFTYNTGNNSAQNRAGSYRKCISGVNWTRPTNGNSAQNSVITVTSNAHGLVDKDIITVDSDNNSQDGTNVTITFIDANKFSYTGQDNGTASGTLAWVRAGTGLYNVAGNVNGPTVAYAITPIEHCTDETFVNCTEYIPNATPAQTPPGGLKPAYVRFCKTQADALAPGAVTGTSGTPATPRCQSKFVDIAAIKYQFPRFGWFRRDTIISTVTPYGNRPNRSDCAAPPNCTYDEEIQNYSKWYTYYRSRMQMMKTSAGRAFLPFISNPSSTPPKPDRLRVGLITIHAQDSGSIVENPAGSGNFNQYLKIDTFNTTNASSWYTKFYEQTPANATPLREALSRAGWIFAGKLDTGLTKGIPATHDPVQASCQKNFTFLTTDGFWNGNAGQTLTGGAIGNRDNVDKQLVGGYLSPNFMVSRASGTYDGNLLPGTAAGATAGGSETLADVAMYYYETDLRPAGSTSPSTTPSGGDVSTNNVQAQSGSPDFAIHQHMNTYTIGLADGLMRWTSDYDDPAKPSDFQSIKNGLPAAGNCFWSGTATGAVCDWPSPQENNQSALDDLWHAAVNGRGTFYSALNPSALATGLSSALNKLNVATASAAAAATSSPQVSQQGTKAFSTLYQTATWSGEVYAQNIDPQTGVVLTKNLPNDGKVWEAQKLLVARANAGTRRLLTYDVGQKAVGATPAINPVSSRLKDFRWTAAANGALYNSEKSAYFLNKCSPLGTMSQCTTLTPLQLLTANDGSSLLDYLSGKATLEGSVFRDRAEIDVTGTPIQTVLGDIVNSQPLFVRPPFFDYSGTRPGGHGEASAPDGAGREGPELYSTFQTNNATRPGALLVGSNDGFLHAFDPNDGQEMWAYTPRFLMPNLYQLADTGYPGQHRFYVDGTPEIADVFDTNTKTWKTIVVGGVNAGGRGFYALDISDPKNPKGLWEFCSDSALCPDDFGSGLDRSDADLGYSYGNPVIGRRKTDGKWIVVLTSGLNNVGTAALPAGDGKGYLYVLDALSGEILHKILADDGSGIGSTTTPQGLMKMGAYYPAGLDDPVFYYVYGGDQQGIVWRVDFTSTTAMATYPAVTSGATWVKRLATLQDADGRIQPITARPAGTHLGNLPYDKNATRIYYVGTGRYVGNSDLSDPLATSGIAWQQTIYGIRDQIDNPRPGWDPKQPFRKATAANVVEQKLDLSGAGPDRTISKNAVDWKTQDGFFVDLNPKLVDKVNGDSPGERVVLDVRLVLGTVIFTSTIPKSGCEPGGDSFQYFLDFRTGGYVGNDSTAIAGKHIGSFLVGTAVEQTADDLVKTLNKTVTGENRTAAIPTDSRFLGQRFSYRER